MKLSEFVKSVFKPFINLKNAWRAEDPSVAPPFVTEGYSAAEVARLGSQQDDLNRSREYAARKEFDS